MERMSAPRPDHARGDARQPARRLRRDGRRARALRPLGQHQGAPRRLHRPVRRRGPDGDAGGAHPGAPRRDALRGRGRARRGAAARRVVDPQRPLPRRHPPPGHHRDHAALPRRRAGGLRGEPRPPRGRGRRGAGQHARAVADARRRGGRDPAHPPDRGGAARARRPDAQPAPARGRPARPARGGARRRRARGGADRALRNRHRARGHARDARLRGAAHTRAHRGAGGRGARGARRAGGSRRRRGAAGPSAGRGRCDGARLLRLGRAARRQPQLPARRDALRLLLRAAGAHRPGRAALRRAPTARSP